MVRDGVGVDRVLIVSETEQFIEGLRQELPDAAERLDWTPDVVTALPRVLSGEVSVLVLTSDSVGGDRRHWLERVRLHPQSRECSLVLVETSDDFSPALRSAVDVVLERSAGMAALAQQVRRLMSRGEARGVAREQWARLTSVIDALPQAILLLDANGNVRSTNTVARELLALTREITQLWTLDRILCALGVASDEASELSRGAAIEGVEIRVRLNNETRQLRGRSHWLPDGGPDASQDAMRMVVFEDITAPRAQEQRRSAYHATIAHDLRTPMAVVRGYLTLLATQATHALTEAHVEYLSRSLHRLDDAESLLDDFLDQAQMEAGRPQLRWEAIELRPTLQLLVDDFQPAPGTEGVALELHYPEELEHEHMRVDARRLRQVIANLITNAQKYAPESPSIEVHVRELPLGLRFEVRDRGPGIDPDARGRVFDPYVRLDDPSAKGAGLGLLIVRSIVEAHGGEVGVDGRDGGGSVFWVELPATLRMQPMDVS